MVFISLWCSEFVSSRTRNAGRDDDNVSSCECLLHAIVFGEVSVNLRHGGDVGQVGGDTGGVDDIVEREVVDLLARFEEEGERL